MSSVNRPNSALAAIQIGEEGDRVLTRGEMILKGTLAAGAAYGLAAMGPFARRALAATEGGDRETLNFLLPFEYLQEELYRRGQNERNDKGEVMKFPPGQKDLVVALLGEERQHIAALKEEIEKLGGKPDPPRNYAFAFRFPETFFIIAGNLETSAIGIYNGLIPELKSKSLRELATSIVQVEGRHAAMVRTTINEEAAPEAFDTMYTKLTAVNSVLKYTGQFF